MGSFLSASLGLLSTASAQTAPAQPYTFTLTNASTTSAGVYNNLPTDSSLVRTLWTAVKYNAGTYNITWDGKDDLGNQVPAGNYLVKVVANNIQYTWMGVVGNTSTLDTGSTVHRAFYYCMAGMTVVNKSAYYCFGYSEARPSVYKFLTSNPQQKIDLEVVNATTANTDIVVNDGTTVYWAGYDAYAPSNSFVWGTRVSDDSYVTYPNGIYYKQVYGKGYNTVNYTNQAKSLITGLAVQKAGKFLFIAREGLNQLSVVDKTTGSLIQTLKINQPKALCTDMNDDLWMVSDSNIVTKYKLNTNGTLSAPLFTIKSTLAPIALAVSPDNITLTIADGYLQSQQVKAFDNSTGIATWVLGTPGGYMQDATVNNNKFYFNDVRGKMYFNGENNFLTFIAFQPDGTFWVGDPGNYRVQHYSANRSFIETIMSLGPSYSTWADKNDNTRVGAEYLEFKINNNVPLTGSSGWQLAKNWGATISSAFDHTTKFATVITLTSGGVKRTFGFLRIANLFYVVELQANNSLRFTGLSMLHCNIDVDGSMLTDDYKKYSFTGFDASNNPTWSKTPIFLTNMNMGPHNPPYIKQWIKNTYLTSTGKVLFYNYGIDLNSSPTAYDVGFHLAAMQVGSNTYLWKTQLATNLTYTGFFPDASRFDIGNKVNNNAGSSVMVSGRNIITGYHGEFWKNGQTNKYNHYMDNGLTLGQFGITQPETAGQAPSMMAGNALSPQLVNGMTTDELFLWHGDESFHAGMHKWRISGLSTITEQDVLVTYPSPSLSPIVVPGSNLMVNLPFSSALSNNTAGWSFNPSTIPKGITIKTNAFVSGTQYSPDVYLTSQLTTGAFSLNRDLGNNTGLVYWGITGDINYFNTNQSGAMTENFDVLDNKGKIIARLTNKFTNVANGNNTNTIFWNNKVLVTGLNTFIQPVMYKLQPVAITAVNNQVTINYGPYTLTAPMFDPTADITSPKTMRVYITGGYNPTPKNFDFKDMQFFTGKINQTLNFSPVLITTNLNLANTLMATSSANLPITFNVISGPATINGNTISLTSNVGVVVVQATQAGNMYYNAAPPVLQTFIVNNLQTIRIDL